jgi:hypothetical protein
VTPVSETRIAGHPPETRGTADTDKMEPLPGTVVPQYTRCGKRTCRCYDGPKHGPYYYRIWREGKSVRKVYVSADDLERVRAQCRLHEEYAGILAAATAQRRELERTIHREMRQARRLGCAGPTRSRWG